MTAVKLLLLGGTRFVGRHLAEAAVAAGHDVTLFHRGQTAPGGVTGAKSLLGDRAGRLEALRGGTWDAAVDFSGYLPDEVEASCAILKGTVGLFAFVSTVSVYADWSRAGDEAAPRCEPLWDVSRGQSGETYGRFKAACEDVVLSAFGPRALIVRPGLIVGPHDPTDRFTYWPARIARGGEVLAPGRPERVVQVIDARDLAAWLLSCVAKGATGTFNACGAGISMKALLETIRIAVVSGARFTWVSDDALARAEVAPYTELPLWIPGVDDQFSSKKAEAAGLKRRPLAQTALDTLEWDKTRPQGPRKNGLSPEKEQELLHGKVRSGQDA
jgi:2'-hydroxyisoflavone reductase